MSVTPPSDIFSEKKHVRAIYGLVGVKFNKMGLILLWRCFQPYDDLKILEILTLEKPKTHATML